MKLSEHRATARIAWRQARLAKARTALVLALIALPVAALTAAGIGIRTVVSTPESEATDQFGSADLSVNLRPDSLTPQSLERALPAGSRVTLARTVGTLNVVRGRLVDEILTEHTRPPDQPPFASRYALLRGRMPTAAGEVALAPASRAKFGVPLGGEVALEDLGLRLRVVGEVIRREHLDYPLMLVGSGTLDQVEDWRVDNTEWLVELPRGISEERAREVASASLGQIEFVGRNEIVDLRRRDHLALAGISFGLTAAALLGTGLIAAAAFGVGARRQLRTLGLIGAAGGSSRHVHAVVLWTGTVLGFTGSVVGVAIGVAAAYGITPHVDTLARRIVGPVVVPLPIVLGGIALGTIAATVAAMTPARQAARQQTVDALAGRNPAPRPPGGLARRGVVAVVGGSVVMGFATVWREDKLLTFALFVTLGGFLLTIPLLVTWIGRTASWLPMSARFAARQTARYGRRTGAAVAAATLALTAPVAMSAYLLSDEAGNDHRSLLGADQIILGSANPRHADGLPDSLLGAVRSALPGSVVAAVRPAVPITPSTKPIDPELRRNIAAKGIQSDPVYVEGPPRVIGPGIEEGSSAQLVIGDADLARALEAPAAIPLLASDGIIAINYPVDHGMLHVNFTPFIGDKALQQGADVPAVTVPGPEGRLEQVPRYLISEHGAAKLGLKPGGQPNALVRARDALSSEDLRRIERVVAAFPGAYKYAQADLVTNSTPYLLALAGAASIVALIIVAVAVALVGAESRRENAVLVAVGAEPGIRRRVVGSYAFLMSALAGVLAIPAGFLPVAIVQSIRPTDYPVAADYPVIVPWATIGIVAVAAPLLAGAIAAVTSRQPTSRALLQPVW